MGNKWRHGLRVALVCLLVFMLSGTSALAASISAVINTNNVRVYQKASTKSKSIKVKKGLKVTVKAYSTKTGWAQITRGKYTGYIPLKYVNRVNPVKAYAARNATVYKTASTSKKLLSVSKGDVFYVLGADGGFSRIQNKSGSKVGYIKTSDITYTKPKVSSSSSSASSAMPASLRSSTSKNGSSSKAKIEYVIYVAQNLLGKPYSSKSNPPKSFDCATFTHYCYDMARKGYIKSSAKSQGYDSRMAQISHSNLKRGDLVCFNTNEKDGDLSDHVGIYLGGGYFIHASSSGGKVMLSSLSSGYYKRTFTCGRRIFG